MGTHFFNCARKLEFVTQFSGKFLREFFQRVFAMKLIAKVWVCGRYREGVGFVCYQIDSKSLKKLAGSGGALIRLNDSHSQQTVPVTDNPTISMVI